MTRIAPFGEVVADRAMVASTSFVRFETVLACDVGRKRLAIASILSSTAAATVRLFAPISIRAVPTTTSSPFSLALPGAKLLARRPPSATWWM